MNYWPTQPTNLSPCHLPMVEYVKSLVPRGKYTAQQYYCKPEMCIRDRPWPRVYYDLADEMGLMVLDETALFGSSIRLNLEEDITWEMCIRDRHRTV